MWGHLCTELSNFSNFNVSFSTHKSEVLIHLSQWQYWWWFWFSFFWTFYFFVILRVMKHRVFKMNIRLNTSFRSRGKWGDYLVTLIPLSWCLNILLNSNFILRMIEWQSESGNLILRIHGKQWYWVYKYDLSNVTSFLETPKNLGTNKWRTQVKGGSQVFDNYLQAAQSKIKVISNKELWEETFVKEFNPTSTFTISQTQKNPTNLENLISNELIMPHDIWMNEPYMVSYGNATENNYFSNEDTSWLSSFFTDNIKRISLKNAKPEKGLLILEDFNKSKAILISNLKSTWISEFNKHIWNKYEVYKLFKKQNILTLKLRYIEIVTKDPADNFVDVRPKDLIYINSIIAEAIWGGEHTEEKMLERWEEIKKRENLKSTTNLELAKKVEETQQLATEDKKIKNKNVYIFSKKLVEDWEDIGNFIQKDNRQMSFYENNTLDDEWEVYSSTKLSDVNSPCSLTMGSLNAASSNNKMFFFRYFDSGELCIEKPDENVDFLVVKQKRYKRKQDIKPYSVNIETIDKDKNLTDTYVKTSRFLKNNLIFGQLSDINESEPYPFYSSVKLNRSRAESFSINLSRRLLRTTRTLVLPAFTNISIIANSYDVVHSWFIPGLGLKIDCVPGKSTHHSLYIDNVGLYYGQCAEICGRYHHHMPIRICALPFEHFLIWWTSKGLPKSLRMRYDIKNIEQTIPLKYSW